MNCADARQILATAVPSDLSHERRIALNAHLERCDACRRYRATVSGIDALISAWGDGAPVRGQAKARAMLQQKARGPQLRLRLRRFGQTAPFRPVLAVAFMLCMLFVALWLIRPPALSTIVRPLVVRPASITPASNKVIVTGNDRVAVTCTAPAYGSQLRNTVTLNCVVDATLDSADAGMLSLRLVGGQNDAQRFFADPVQVGRGKSTTPIDASLDGERLRATFGPGQVQVEAVLRASDGTLLASVRSPSATFLIP